MKYFFGLMNVWFMEQILFKWLEHASCSKLYIIDDQVATDPILQGVLTMTVPESVEVFFIVQMKVLKLL